MYFVQINPGLSDQIVISNKISIPYLHRKYIGVHVLGFGRVADWKLEAIVEVAS